jgi:hypothetical protein
MKHKQVPDDFPREPDPGAVCGAQAKLLVREVRGQYQRMLSEEELLERYDVCEDLAAQLARYAAGKIATASLSLDVALRRAEKGLRLKVDSAEWEFSQLEVAWVVNRMRHLLTDGTPTR